jgi:hypothetical protein
MASGEIADGIEIHFNSKRGWLELACEPDAFAPYREIARKQLAGTEIPIDEVIEINIVDTATFVARRDAPRKRLIDILVASLITAILVLAIIGAFGLVSKLVAAFKSG